MCGALPMGDEPNLGAIIWIPQGNGSWWPAQIVDKEYSMDRCSKENARDILVRVYGSPELVNVNFDQCCSEFQKVLRNHDFNLKAIFLDALRKSISQDKLHSGAKKRSTKSGESNFADSNDHSRNVKMRKVKSDGHDLETKDLGAMKLNDYKGFVFAPGGTVAERAKERRQYSLAKCKENSGLKIEKSIVIKVSEETDSDVEILDVELLSNCKNSSSMKQNEGGGARKCNLGKNNCFKQEVKALENTNSSCVNGVASGNKRQKAKQSHKGKDAEQVKSPPFKDGSHIKHCQNGKKKCDTSNDTCPKQGVQVLEVTNSSSCEGVTSNDKSQQSIRQRSKTKLHKEVGNVPDSISRAARVMRRLGLKAPLDSPFR